MSEKSENERNAKINWVENYLLQQLQGEKKNGITTDDAVRVIIGKYRCTRITARSYLMSVLYDPNPKIVQSADYSGLLILAQKN